MISYILSSFFFFRWRWSYGADIFKTVLSSNDSSTVQLYILGKRWLLLLWMTIRKSRCTEKSNVWDSYWSMWGWINWWCHVWSRWTIQWWSTVLSDACFICDLRFWIMTNLEIHTWKYILKQKRIGKWELLLSYGNIAVAEQLS